MIVSFPMYDRPELRAAHRAWWTGIRDALGHGPEALTVTQDLWPLWKNPDLLLSQTCGLPFSTDLRGIGYVGSPDFGLPNVPAGHYNSVLIAREEDDRALRDLAQRAAINQRLSQSGFGALVQTLGSIGIVPKIVLETGAHLGSVKAVRAGQADLTAIDAHTWRLARQFDGASEGLREIARSTPTPATPYVTQCGKPSALFSAMNEALRALPAQHQQALGIRKVIKLNEADYYAVKLPDEGVLPLQA